MYSGTESSDDQFLCHFDFLFFSPSSSFLIYTRNPPEKGTSPLLNYLRLILKLVHPQTLVFLLQERSSKGIKNLLLQYVVPFQIFFGSKIS